MQTIEFRATHEPDTRRDQDVIAELKKGPIPANTTRKWALEMEIPQMEVYNLNACSYIDIDYKFKVSFVFINFITTITLAVFVLKSN